MSMNIREPKDKYVKEFIRDVIDKLYRDSIEKEKALNEEDRQYTEWKEEKLQHAFLNPDDEQRMQEWDDNIKHKYKLNSIYLEDAEETMNLPEFMNESMFKEMTLEKIRDIVSKNEAFYNALDEGIYSLWKEVVERRKREEKPALSAKLVKELEEDREIGLIHEAFGDVKTHFLIEAVYAKILKKWVEVKETPSAPTSFTGFVKDFIAVSYTHLTLPTN